MNNVVHKDIFLNGTKFKLVFRNINSGDGTVKRLAGINKDGNVSAMRLDTTSSTNLANIDAITEVLTNFSNLDNSNAHTFVLAPNGFLYSAPAEDFGSGDNRRRIIKHNTVDGSTTNVFIINTPSHIPYNTNPQITTAKLGENGKLYFFPWRLSYPIIIIDPTTDTATTFSLGFTTSDWAYNGAVIHGGNKFYIMCGRGNTGVIEYDYITGTKIHYPLTAPFTSPNYYDYSAGCLGIDGHVYFAPRRSTVTDILKFNTTTKAYSYIPLGFAQFGNLKYENMIMLRNGDLLGLPTDNLNKYFVFNTTTLSVKTFDVPVDMSIGANNFLTYKFAYKGKKLFLSNPSATGRITVIDVKGVKNIVDNTVLPSLASLATSNYNKYWN